MGARWGVRLPKGASNVQTIGVLACAATAPLHRARVNDVSVGCSASPADNTFDIVFQRCTTVGTGTGVTPNAMDPADTTASTIQAVGTITSDPALTASAFLGGIPPINQRASFRWVAVPAQEIVIPAVASNGIAIALSATSTTTFTANAGYEEL
jgi:hypothetical protein